MPYFDDPHNKAEWNKRLEQLRLLRTRAKARPGDLSPDLPTKQATRERITLNQLMQRTYPELAPVEMTAPVKAKEKAEPSLLR